jgi:hypothetical protein
MRKLIVTMTKAVGIYEPIRSRKDRLYRGLRDSDLGIELGIRYLLGGRFGNSSSYAREAMLAEFGASVAKGAKARRFFSFGLIQKK